MNRLLKQMKRYIPPALIILLLTSLAAPAAAQPLAVDASLLNVRSGPGTNHSVLTQVPRNTVLTPVEEQGSWVRVVLPDGSRGWVASDYTSPFVPQRFAVVDIAVLNVRSGPGTSHKILTQFEHQTAAAVLGERDGWLNVLRPEGGQGWLAGSYTSLADCSGYAAVTATLLNVRSGAGTSFKVINQLPRGEEAAVIGQDGVWLRVVMKNGATGWVVGEYTSQPASSAKSPLSGKTIVIDPGHGGPDPGAIGITGYYEKTVNLAVSLQLAPMLARAGARVILTRNADYGPSLWERVNIANTAWADVFVSIHSNAHLQSWANGTETYYYAYSANSGGSGYLARQLQQQLVWTLGLKDLGVKTAGFYVISNTRMPSALVELGFVSNYGDEAVLRQPQTHQRAAEALLRGLEAYFK